MSNQQTNTTANQTACGRELNNSMREETKKRGLIAYIYKNGGDCSNGGISSRADKVCIVNIDGPFEASDEFPAVRLVAGHLRGTARIVPDDLGGRHSMFGGCYVAACDSRFTEAVEALLGQRMYGAVALHDRIE